MVRSYVIAFWGPRAEPAAEAAGLLERFLHALAAIDPALSGWRNAGMSKSEVLRQPLVIPDRAHLQTRLLDSRERNDYTGEPIEERGYSKYWVNGQADPAANLSIRMAVTTPGSGNHIKLGLPDPITTPGIYSRSTARTLMHTFVEIFRPESGVWGNRKLYKGQKEPDTPAEGGYRVGAVVGHEAGWANYLHDTDSAKFDPAMLPASATIERIGDGTLVMVGDHPADPPMADVLMVRAAMGYDVPTLNP